MNAAREDKATIMIVDDEPYIREEISEYLTYKGYKTICCDDGMMAQEAFSQNNIDVLITDVKMPKCDG